MSNIHFEPEPGSRDAMPGIGVPKPALYMAAMLVLVTFALAISARFFGFGAFGEPENIPVLVSRSLTFTDQPDGGILVHDAETQQVAIALPPNSGGFIRGSLRALTRKRRLANIGPATPFVLTRYEDGRLVLDDPATKASVTISSFGPTQIAAFDTLLFAGRVAAPASAGTAAVSDSGRSSP
jgi:putative photosynthetic complex assembly protein